MGPQGEIFAPLTAFLSETFQEPQIHLQAIETLNIIFSRGNEPLIRALYPFAVPGTNVYVTCMMCVGPNTWTHFDHIWAAYCKSIGDADELAPLLFQCALREVAAVSAANGGVILANATTGSGSKSDLKEEVENNKNEKETLALKGIVDALAAESSCRPGLTATEFVTEQRLRKRIAEDLKMMIESYLKVQVEKRREIDDQLDFMTSNIVNLKFK